MSDLFNKLVKESDIDEKKKRKGPAQNFTLTIDVNTKLGWDDLKKLVDKIVGYAAGKGHKMEIVQVSRKD